MAAPQDDVGDGGNADALPPPPASARPASPEPDSDGEYSDNSDAELYNDDGADEDEEDASGVIGTAKALANRAFTTVTCRRMQMGTNSDFLLRSSLTSDGLWATGRKLFWKLCA